MPQNDDEEEIPESDNAEADEWCFLFITRISSVIKSDVSAYLSGKSKIISWIKIIHII